MNAEHEQAVRKDQIQMANDNWGSASVITQVAQISKMTIQFWEGMGRWHLLWLSWELG